MQKNLSADRPFAALIAVAGSSLSPGGRFFADERRLLKEKREKMSRTKARRAQRKIKMD
jgi:hypothetical protein